MKKPLTIARVIPAILVGCLLLLASCTTSKWPQFRGPESNMVVANNNLPDEWGADKNIRWTCDLSGVGWSSPVVWGNKIFITSAFGEKVSAQPAQGPPQGPPPGQGPGGPQGRPQGSPQGGPPQGMSQPPGPPMGMQEDDKSYLNEIYRWEVTCIDLKTGKELWKQVARKGAPRHRKQPGNTYASETPVTDGKRVYAYFGMTGLFCYDLDGNLLWEKDLGAYQTTNGWGTGSSPAVYRDKVFVQVDNDTTSFIVALDAKNGEEIWKTGRDEKTNFCTPVIWKNSIRTELVASGKTVRSYDPETGKVLWQMLLGGEMVIPSPVPQGDLIYIGNNGGRDVKGKLFAVKAGAEGDITPSEGETSSSGVAWLQPDAGTANPSPLVHDGLIYILASRGGEIACFDASTGENVYREKADSVGACWASPWINNDKLFFNDEKGTTHVIKAGRQFEPLFRNKLDDKTWTSVAITKDAYILKGVKKLYCIGL